MRHALLLGTFAAVLSTTGSLLAQDPTAPDAAPKPRPVWERMDYGPVLGSTVQGYGEDNFAYKGRLVFLGDDAGVAFDTELLRVVGAWANAPALLRGTAYDGRHGPVPSMQGDAFIRTEQLPGIAGPDETFSDPRKIPFGPLPRDWGRFVGHWFHGDRVVLGYDVLGRGVLETYDAVRNDAGEVVAIARTIECGPGSKISLVAADLPESNETGGLRAESAGEANEFLFYVGSVDVALGVRTLGAPEGVNVRASGKGRLIVDIDASTGIRRATLLHRRAATVGELDLGLASGFTPPADLAAFTRPGPNPYPQTITTEGQIGEDTGPFAVDTISVPSKNPFDSRLRFAAFDFVDEDTAALSTWNGDVWLVDGLDGDLDELVWRRFCTGLHDPLGLKVVNGVIHVHGRDGLYQLVDENQDGWCDFVSVFNNEVYVTKGFHEFAFDLQTDDAGNFYFSKGGPVNPGGRGFQELTPHSGTILRVDPNGENLTVVATGCRAPNGISVRGDGVFTSGDNEGTWVPTSRVSLSTNGTFFGCVDLAQMGTPPTMYDQPICFLPHGIDNSCGGQIWVPEGRWGSFGGELLHQSYGKSSLFLVMRQESQEGMTQGGAYRLPVQFASSQMRGRFANDGHLYTVGFKGWQTNAARETAFQRVRRTEAPLRMPVGFKTYREGIALTFSTPLDAELAKDLESYTAEIWNYDWSVNYGSKEYSVREPERQVEGRQKNRDALKISDVSLSDDGLTVFLRVEKMDPCMQIRVEFDLEDRGGELVAGEVHGTVHFLESRPSGTK